ncbi:protein kinase A [Sarotherodon galilaeus]
MGINVAVGCIVSFVLLDVVNPTVHYAHGSQLSTFAEDALNFNILQSALDIWGTVLLRASLLLGASLGVTWNKVDGPQRVAKSTSLILLICLIVITYTLAKLLMLTKVRTLSINDQPWLLSLICWTCASSLGVMLLWRWLGKDPESESSLIGDSSSSSGSGQCKGHEAKIRIQGARGREDTEKLVETVGEEEQELGSERKKGKDSSSGATLGRLLNYSKKDAELLSVAVLFLIIAAVCETFIPYYYGKVIDSMVVHQSMEYFAKPVIILASIASVYTGLMQGVGAAEKVFEYLDRKPEHPSDGTEAPETCAGLVEFKDVMFAYPTRPETDILKGVSFLLRPGEVTALVRPSGSGKSSCVSLLENFYLPQQGQVLLDGKPLSVSAGNDKN